MARLKDITAAEKEPAPGRQAPLWRGSEWEVEAPAGGFVPDNLIRALRQNTAVLNELAVRYGVGAGASSPTFGTAEPGIGCPQDIADLLGAEMKGLVQEQLRVLLLNTKNGVVGQQVVYRGMVNSIDIRVAEVIRPAVATGSPAIIIVHNHPSGDPTPSPEDMVCTRRMVEAANLLDVVVLDHVVVCMTDRWVSMRERGLVKFDSDSQSAAMRRSSRFDGYGSS